MSEQTGRRKWLRHEHVAHSQIAAPSCRCFLVMVWQWSEDGGPLVTSSQIRPVPLFVHQAIEEWVKAAVGNGTDIWRGVETAEGRGWHREGEVWHRTKALVAWNPDAGGDGLETAELWPAPYGDDDFQDAHDAATRLVVCAWPEAEDNDRLAAVVAAMVASLESPTKKEAGA